MQNTEQAKIRYCRHTNSSANTYLNNSSNDYFSRRNLYTPPKRTLAHWGKTNATTKLTTNHIPSPHNIYNPQFNSTKTKHSSVVIVITRIDIQQCIGKFVSWEHKGRSRRGGAHTFVLRSLCRQSET